jgi:hypothetical protein
MSEKKASEILLELDNRLKNLERQLKLQEFQLRIIIDNFNSFNKILQDNNLPVVETPKAQPIITEVKANQTSTDKDYNFKSEVKTNPAAPKEKPAKPKPEKPEPKARKLTVPVTQVLNYKNGDPVIAGNIVIKDSKGRLIKVTNTNTVGRWQAFLEEGNYTVFAKGTSSTDEVVDFFQSFEITGKVSPLNLQQPENR